MEQYLSRTRIGAKPQECDSKHGCSKKDIEKFYQIFAKDTKLVNFQNFNFADFHHWIDQMDSPKREFGIVYTGKTHYYQLKMFGYNSNMVCVKGKGFTKKEQYYSIVKQLFGQVKQQMMEGNENGVGAQIEEKATTTIITADTGIETSDITPSLMKTLNELCNTEQTFTMDNLTDRWELLKRGQITVDTAFSEVIVVPRDLFTTAKLNSANLLLFKNFVYTSNLEIEVRMVVNGPKFGQGRLIMSRFPDTFDNIHLMYADKQSLLQRPHVFIDLNSVNQASIIVPKEIRKTFIRNKAHETSNTGVPYGQMGAVQIELFSPYKTGPDQPTTINYSIFYKFKKIDFAGVSFGVNLQMDKIASGFVELAGDAFPPVRAAEKYLKRVGIIHNQDKPFDSQAMRIVPIPRLNFCNGVGISDALPLMMDGLATITTLTDHLGAEDPKTIYEIARKWGWYGSFFWKKSHKADDILWSTPINPTNKPAIDESSKRVVSRPTPLAYVSSSYAFWRGTIDFKFNFISTPFHTGSIQIQIGYGRADSNSFDAASEYTKVFDLGMVNETEITIPYIYDTPWRRTTDIQYPTNDNWSWQQTLYNPWPLSVDMITLTSIKIRVINPLLPLQNVLDEIECIVQIRAGDDYQLRGLVPNFYTRAAGIQYYIPYDTLPCFEDNPYLTEEEKVFRKVPRITNSYVNASSKPTMTSGKLQADFGHGDNNFVFHTTDNDGDLKTILRRNYYIHNIKFENAKFRDLPKVGEKQDIEARGTQHYWLPVMMPNILRSWSYSGARSNPLWTYGTVFRHWRGSMRYTIVMTEPTRGPVEISYVPNIGTKYYGFRELVLEAKIGTAGEWKTLTPGSGNMSEFGFATELMMGSVNTTIAVTVPFDVDFNKCVTLNRAMTSTNDFIKIVSREDCTDFSGHLVIRADKDAVLDIYMSVGDDFDLHSFIGTPSCDVAKIANLPDTYMTQFTKGVNKGNGLIDSIEIENKVANESKMKKKKQVGFHLNEVHLTIPLQNYSYKIVAESHQQMFNNTKAAISEFRDLTKQTMEDVSDATTSLNRNVTILGTQLLVAADKNTETFTKATDKLSETQDKIVSEMAGMSNNMEKVTAMFGENSKKISHFIDTMMAKFNSLIPDSVCAMGKQIAQFSTNLIFDLIILLKDFSFSTLALMLVKYIAQIFMINYSEIMEWVEKLTKLIKEKVGYSTQQIKSDERPAQSLFGFFCSMIASFCKFKLGPNKKFYDYGSKQLDFIFDNKNVNYMNGVMSLVERVTSTMVSAINWVANRKEIVPTMREFFSGKQEELATFMENVDSLTNPANKHLLNRADMKAKCFTTFLEAQAIRKEVCTMPGNQSANILNQYCNRMLKFTEEHWSRFSCCPVRMEPRVICFTGESNIGKSFMAEQFVAKMLKSIDYQAVGVNPIFVRNPGRKHWDGYNDQPAILFDDWMNLKDSESIRDQLADLYELKSTCDFMPAMASIVDKGVRGNPKLIVLLTNNAFPDTVVQAGAVHKEAVYRRRDLVIEVRKVSSLTQSALRANNVDLAEPSFEHLQFAVVDSIEPTPQHQEREWKTWAQIIPELQEDFKTYYIEEQAIAKQRLNSFCADLPPQIRDLADPLATFQYRSNSAAEIGTGTLPSSVLAKELEEVMKQLKTVYDTDARQQMAGWNVFKKQKKFEYNHWSEIPSTQIQTMLDLLYIYKSASVTNKEKNISKEVLYRSGCLVSMAVERMGCFTKVIMNLIKATENKELKELVNENKQIELGNYEQKGDQMVLKHWKKVKPLKYPIQFLKMVETMTQTKLQKLCESYLPEPIKELEFPDCDRFVIEKNADGTDRTSTNVEWNIKCWDKFYETGIKKPRIFDEIQTYNSVQYGEGGVKLPETIDPFEETTIFGVSFEQLVMQCRDVPDGYQLLMKDKFGAFVPLINIEPWQGDQTCEFKIIRSGTYGLEEKRNDYCWQFNDFEWYPIKISHNDYLTLTKEQVKSYEIQMASVLSYLMPAIEMLDGPSNVVNNINRMLVFQQFFEKREVVYETWPLDWKLETFKVVDKLDLSVVAMVQEAGEEIVHVPMIEVVDHDMIFDYEMYDNLYNGARTQLQTYHLRRKAREDPQFFYDSVVGKRDFLEMKITARKRMSEQIQINCQRDVLIANKLNFRNIEIYNGITMASFYQEQFDPKMNEMASDALFNCQHCRQPKLIQYGNDEHHVCGDCKISSKCDYCATTGVNNGLRMKQFWYLFKYGLTVSKISKFISWLFGVVPNSVYKIIKHTLVSAFMAAGYTMGALIGILGYCKLYNAFVTQQNDDCFSGEIFQKMIDQRENYEDTQMCLHKEAMDLTNCSYSNFNWLKNVEEVPIAIPIYPCKRNCCLFDGRNMDEYRRACYKYSITRESIITESYAEIARNPGRTADIIGGIPPFARHYVTNYDGALDRYEISVKRKYRQIINRAINASHAIVGANPTMSTLKFLAKIGGALLGAILAIRGLYSLVSGLFKSKPESMEIEQQAEASYNPAPRHFYEERKNIAKAKIGNKTQGSDTFDSTLELKLAKNTLNINVYSENDVFVNTLIGTGVRDRLVCIPKHYYSYMRKMSANGCKLKLKRPYYPECEVTYVFDEADFNHSDISDLSIFSSPKTLNMYVNIVGYLATYDDFSKSISRSGKFFRGATKTQMYPITHAIEIYGFKKNVKLIDSEYSELQHVLHYNYSEDGACGSFVLRCNHHRPILGMHVAGSTKSKLNPDGYAVVIYQDLFRSMPGYGLVDQADDLEDNVATSKTFFPDGIKLQLLNVSETAVHLPSKTKIKPSEIHEYDGPALTKPAYLTRNDPGYPHKMSPLMAGCSKHGILTENFSTGELNEVTDALWYAKYVGMKPAMATPERLTLKQSITGLNIDGYDQLKIDTSAGYPFVLTADKQKKDHISVSDEQERESRSVEIRESTLQHLLEMEDLRMNGIRPMLPYVDELKDERKKIEKREKLGGTRVFCMSPLSTTVAVRANFLHFAVAYKNNRMDLQHAVGISRDGPEWTKLAQELLQFGNNIVTLDYSNFGPGYNAGVNSCAHEIITRWTKKYVSGVNDKEMAVLGEEHYNSLHIMGNLIYRQLSGGPSGDALTVVKNGLVNELYLLLAWRGIVRKTDLNHDLYKSYFENVKAICFGDDVIMSVSDKYCEIFNGESISDFFAKYKIVATDAEKSDKISKFKPLHEATFLKSGFVQHPNRQEFLAPIEFLSISETPRWIFPSPDDGLATQFNAEQALRLSYGHGPETFNALKQKLNEALILVKLKPILITWNELDKIYFE